VHLKKLFFNSTCGFLFTACVFGCCLCITGKLFIPYNIKIYLQCILSLFKLCIFTPKSIQKGVVEKINLNLNAKCVKQIGVLLSAAKRHDQIRQTIQHARCGTLNDSHSILWKSAERPKTFYSYINCF